MSKLINTPNRQIIGTQGENRAVSFILTKGYRILTRNFRCRLGEIDIIAWDRDTIVFLEVKTRSNQFLGLPQEAVTPHKQRQIIRTALFYLKKNHIQNQPVRFDVVGITEGKIELIVNAFTYISTGYTY